MLRPRIIPSLLIHDKGLVKTVKFKDHKYIGDPINAVKIFNEKEVDELAIFDIDATVLGNEPNYILIEKLANQSRMPLCYGGGVKTVKQAQRIFSLGVEKIALSSSIIQNPNLITEISEKVGSQSVIVVLDVKKKLVGGYEIYTHNGKKSTGISPIKFAKMAQKRQRFLTSPSAPTSALRPRRYHLRKTHPLLSQLFLCLSRACLGKTMHFYI